MGQLLITTMQGDAPLLLEAMSKTAPCWTAEEKLELLNSIYVRNSMEAEYFFHILGTGSVDAVLQSNDHRGTNILHVLADKCQIVYLDTCSRDRWTTAVQRHATDPNLIHAQSFYISEESGVYPLCRSLI